MNRASELAGRLADTSLPAAVVGADAVVGLATAGDYRGVSPDAGRVGEGSGCRSGFCNWFQRCLLWSLAGLRLVAGRR